MIVNFITTGSPILNINLSADMLILNAFAINVLSCTATVWADTETKHHRQIRAHNDFNERIYHLLLSAVSIPAFVLIESTN